MFDLSPFNFLFELLDPSLKLLVLDEQLIYPFTKLRDLGVFFEFIKLKVLLTFNQLGISFDKSFLHKSLFKFFLLLIDF